MGHGRRVVSGSFEQRVQDVGKAVTVTQGIGLNGLLCDDFRIWCFLYFCELVGIVLFFFFESGGAASTLLTHTASSA